MVKSSIYMCGVSDAYLHVIFVMLVMWYLHVKDVVFILGSFHLYPWDEISKYLLGD